MHRAVAETSLGQNQAAAISLAVMLVMAVAANSLCLAGSLAVHQNLSNLETSEQHPKTTAYNRFAFAVLASHWRIVVPAHNPSARALTKREAVAIAKSKRLIVAESSSNDIQNILADENSAETEEAIKSRPSEKGVVKSSEVKSFEAPRRLGYRRPARSNSRKTKRTKPKNDSANNWKMRALFPDA